jgi:hypothetical protein
MGFTIKNDRTKETIELVDKKVIEALKAVGLLMESDVSSVTPVHTGLLKNSIASGVGGEKVTKSEYGGSDGKTGHYSGSLPTKPTPYVAVGTNVEYAAHKEYGTSKMKATNNGKGFLRYAVRNNLNFYKKTLEDILKS